MLILSIEVLKANFYYANGNGTSSSACTKLRWHLQRRVSKWKIKTICETLKHLRRARPKKHLNRIRRWKRCQQTLFAFELENSDRGSQLGSNYAFWSNLPFFDVTRRGGRNRKTNCRSSNMEKGNATRKETQDDSRASQKIGQRCAYFEWNFCMWEILVNKFQLKSETLLDR